MLAIGLIIFREVIEIALILSVLLVATRGLVGRKRAIWSGLILGVGGSALVAYFADAISEAVEGMGQEVFNATIMFSAAALISWTVVWMKYHGRQLTAHLKEVGRKVTSGELPVYTLALVVGLSMLREGSEIVLFTYGVLASGEALSAVALGFGVGMSAGLAVGIALYFGLIKINPKHLFGVTTWLLAFVAAGMASQAVGFLNAAGMMPELAPVLWNTSAFISEQSFIGKILHALIGYTDRPSGMQVLFYLSTLGGIYMLSRVFSAKTQPPQSPSSLSKVKAMAIMLLFLGAPMIHPASSEASKQVYSPIVEKGELEFEYKGSYDFDDKEEKEGKQKHYWAVGYAPTDFWFTEVGLIAEAENRDAVFKLEEIRWENIVQFFDQGRYWVDSGLYLEYEAPVNTRDPHKIEAKLLLEKSFTKSVHTANIILERKIGAHTDKDFEGGFAWSSRYRWREVLEPGFEYYGSFDKLNDRLAYGDQSHQLGPVIYGKLSKHVKYELGFLFGISDAAPDGMLKWILEFEF